MVALTSSKWRPLPPMVIIVATGCCQVTATVTVINGKRRQDSAVDSSPRRASYEMSSRAECVSGWTNDIIVCICQNEHGEKKTANARGKHLKTAEKRLPWRGVFD